jgi:DinB superfamily
MPAKLPWFERRFNFDFPVDVYPDVMERIRGTPARVGDRARGLSREKLIRRDGKTWSIQENVGHLLDLGLLDAARLDDYLKGETTLRVADLTNRRTHESAHNDKDLAALLAEFRAERETLVKRLEGLSASDFARTAVHPRLNVPMRMVDWLTFVACHDDYHLSRISELIRMFAG